MPPHSTRIALRCALAAGAIPAAAGIPVLAGMPELVPCALLALALAGAGWLARLYLPFGVWRPYLWPFVAAAALALTGTAYLARESPWALTPSFLAPELPLRELGASLRSRTHTKVRLAGRVAWWDPYPYGPRDNGLEDPLKVRLEDRDGALDVILDRAELERELAAGQELRLVGRVGPWESGIARVVALSVEQTD